MTPIHLRNVPPPWETFNHTKFMEHIFMWLKPEQYLELGVREGHNLNSVSNYCIKSIGVDLQEPHIQFGSNVEFYKMTTDDFLTDFAKDWVYDAVFIDADHSYEQSLKDFENVKNNVIEDGFIFLHDTYPYDEIMFDPGLSHEVYKTALYIKENYIDEFEILTLPFNPGFTIVKKMKRNKQLIYL